MGRFVNPDNSGFQQMLNSEIYVDKTGLIDYTNRMCNTPQGYICNSRPRRFGKSYTAEMLTAYYSKGCDSDALFQKYAIGSQKSSRTYLNRCNVIHLDLQWCMMDAGAPEAVVPYLNQNLLQELSTIFPDVDLSSERTVYGALSRIYAQTGEKFVVIIDEWDALIRDENATQKVQDDYISFLRGMFKGSEPTRFITLAYLTGILPIKKQKTQLALNNFDEYTMLYPGTFAPYIGFTGNEVRALCDRYHRDFESVRQWYDGYKLENYDVYNPRAVVSVMLNGTFQSYWSGTGSYESIVPLISMDFDELRQAVIEMLAGASVPVNVNSFQNDMVSFSNRDDVMTALLHLGYLAYDPVTRTAHIPNEEIQLEFENAVRSRKWSELDTFRAESENLLEATLDGEEEKVAEDIEKIHNEYASSIQYNNENSLSSVLTIAYLASLQYYFRPVREFPTGRGFADFIYIPKPEYRHDYPALVVELKWNQSAHTAIQQIREKHNTGAIREYTGDILLAGISYDKKTRKHQCRIEMEQSKNDRVPPFSCSDG